MPTIPQDALTPTREPIARRYGPTPARRLAVLGVLGAVYYIAGDLGLRLAFLHPSATPVWPPTGIALAAFLILGLRVWPAIFVSAFLLNLSTHDAVATSLGIAIGNTLEGLLGAYLVDRYAGGRGALIHARGVLRFAILAVVMGTALGATIGVTTLALGGLVGWTDYQAVWLTWWIGDAGGALMVAPVLLLWSHRSPMRWTPKRALEGILLFATVVGVGQVVFAGIRPPVVVNIPLEVLTVPVFLWAAIRFGPREAAIAVLVLCAIAIRGTLLGFGPFSRETPNNALLLVLAFMIVGSLTTFMVAAVVAERARVEAQLRHLSMSDGLTGLANYRHLLEGIQREIDRYGRTGLPFTILLFDIDDLTGINDRYGHVVGSRALCRFADALTVSCRSADIPARYGGDEFALVVPEAADPEALVVGQRVRERLARDGGDPAVTVSIGFAEYPRDGETPEALLGSADRALYRISDDVSGASVRPRTRRVAG